MRSELERLLDILEAVERIEKYAAQGKMAFEDDELIQNWMINHIALIGEACRPCPMTFRLAMPMCPGQTSLPCETFSSITTLGLTQRQSGRWWNAISLN